MKDKDRRYMLLLAVLILGLLAALTFMGCADLQRRINEAVTPSSAQRVAQMGQTAQIAGALIPGPVGDLLSYGGYGLGGIASIMGVYIAGKKRQAKKEAAATAPKESP